MAVQNNVINFVTQASLGGINAMNKALQSQLSTLRAIGQTKPPGWSQGAGGQMRNPAGQFASKAQYQQAVAAAGAAAKQINQQMAQASAQAGQALAQNFARGANQGAQAAIASLGRVANAMVSGLGAAASVAGGAIRMGLGGAFTAVSGTVKTLTSAVGGLSRSLANIATSAGLLATIFGAKAIQSASQVQDALAKVNTIARTTPDVLDEIGDGLTRMSATSSKSFADLSTGFYDLLSAGLGMKDGVVQVADGMTLMKDATDLAVGGIGSVDQSVDLLTSVLNAFRLDLSESTHVVDVFAKAVELGKVTTGEISEVISTVSPLASSMGLSIEEVGAALAVMTQQGFTAGESMTAMRSALVGVQRNSKFLQRAQKGLAADLAAAGVATIQELVAVKGLQPAMALLAKESERTGVPLIKMLGRIEGVQYVLGTTGKQAGAFALAMEAMSNSSGSAAEQAALRLASFSEQMKILQNAVFELGAEIGESLLPPMTQLIGGVSGAVRGITDFVRANKGFFDVAAPILGVVSALLALQASASLMTGVAARFGGQLGALSLGFAGIARAIFAVAFPLAIAVGAFLAFQKAVTENLAGFGQFGKALFAAEERIDKFIDVIKAGVDAIGAIFNALVTGSDASHAIDKFVDSFGSFASLLVDDIKKAIPVVMGELAKLLPKIVNWAVDTARSLAPVVAGIAQALWNWVQEVAPVVLAGLGSLVGQIGAFIGREAPNVANALRTLLLGAMQWIGRDILPKIGPALSGILDGIVNFLRSDNSVQMISRGVGQLAGAFIGGLIIIFASVTEWIAGNADQIVAAFVEFGKQVIAGFFQGMRDVSPVLADIAQVVVAVVVPAFIAWKVVTLAIGVALGLWNLARTIQLILQTAAALVSGGIPAMIAFGVATTGATAATVALAIAIGVVLAPLALLAIAFAAVGVAAYNADQEAKKQSDNLAASGPSVDAAAERIRKYGGATSSLGSSLDRTTPALVRARNAQRDLTDEQLRAQRLWANTKVWIANEEAAKRLRETVPLAFQDSYRAAALFHRHLEEAAPQMAAGMSGVGEAAKKAAEEVKGFGTAALEAALAAGTAFAAAVEKVSSYETRGPKVVDILIDSIRKSKPKFRAAAVEGLQEYVTAWGTEAAEQMPSLGEQTILGLIEFMNEAAESEDSATRSLAAGISIRMAEALAKGGETNILPVIGDLMATINAEFAKGTPAAIDRATDWMSGIAEGIRANEDPKSQTYKTMTDIINLMSANTAAGYMAGYDLMYAYVSGLVKTLPALVDIMKVITAFQAQLGAAKAMGKDFALDYGSVGQMHAQDLQNAYDNEVKKQTDIIMASFKPLDTNIRIPGAAPTGGGGGGGGGGAEKSPLEKALEVAKAGAELAEALQKVAGLDIEAMVKESMGKVAKAMLLAEEITYKIVKGFGKKKLQAVADFSDSAQKLISLLGSAVEAFDKVREFKGVTRAQLQKLAQDIQWSVEVINFIAKKFSPKQVAVTSVFAEVAEKVVSLMGDATEAFAEMATFQHVPRRVLAQIAQDIKWSIEVIAYTSRHVNEEGLRQAQAFAKAAKDVIDLIGDAFEAFDKIKEFKQVPRRQLALLSKDIQWSVEVTQYIASKVNKDGLKAAAEFAKSAKEVIDLIGTAYEAFSKFDKKTGYTPVVGGFKALGEDIEAGVNEIIRVSDAVDDQGVAAAKVFSEAAKEVVGLIGDSLEAFAEVPKKGYVNVAGGFKNLADDIEKAVRELIRVSDLFKDKGAVKAAGEFADNAGKVVEVIGGALEAFKELDKYAGVTKEKLAQIITDIGIAVDGMIAKMGEMELDEDELKDINAFTTAIEGVMGAISATMETFGGIIRDKLDPATQVQIFPDLSAIWSQMEQSLLGMQKLTELDVDLDEIKELAETASDVAGSISAFLSLGESLSEENSKEGGALLGRVQAALAIVGQVVATWTATFRIAGNSIIDYLIVGINETKKKLADALTAMADEIMPAFVTDMGEWGTATGNAYVDALVAALEAGKVKITTALGLLAALFEAGSPPGPESPLHEIDRWGNRTALAYAEGWIQAMPTMKRMLAGILGVIAAPFQRVVTPIQEAAQNVTRGLNDMGGDFRRAESQLGILSPLGNPEDFALDQNYFVKPGGTTVSGAVSTTGGMTIEDWSDVIRYTGGNRPAGSPANPISNPVGEMPASSDFYYQQTAGNGLGRYQPAFSTQQQPPIDQSVNIHPDAFRGAMFMGNEAEAERWVRTEIAPRLQRLRDRRIAVT